MIYSGSIIVAEKGLLEKVKGIIKNYPQIEIYGEDKKNNQLVITIEEKGSRELEALCETLKQNPEVIEISHTNFYFGDETDKLIAKKKVSEKE